MEKFVKAFYKVDKVVDKITEYMSFIFFFGMVIIGGISVFSRFVFNLSITWAEEAIRFLCIWLTWVGSSLTVRKDGHVSIDIFIGMIKNNKLRAIYYLVSRLVGVVFLCILLPASIELVKKTGSSLAASIPIKWSYIYLAVPVGIIFMLWAYAAVLPMYTKKAYIGEETLMDQIEAEKKENLEIENQEMKEEKTND